jgi:hypothetical protein
MELNLFIKELDLNVVKKVIKLVLLEVFDYLFDFRYELFLLMILGLEFVGVEYF